VIYVYLRVIESDEVGDFIINIIVTKVAHCIMGEPSLSGQSRDLYEAI